MAQTKKEEVRDRILAAAKTEFLKHGFQNTSLRTIADSANVSVANIYSYAAGKNDLFRAVLADVLDDFDRTTARFKTYNLDSNDLSPLEFERELVRAGASYVYQKRVELNLLLNLSQGSALERYSEQVVEGYADNCKRFLKRVTQTNEGLTLRTPSEFFFKSVARFVLRAIAEAVKDDMSLGTMEDIADEIARYNFHGFEGLAEVTYLKRNKSHRR